MLKKYVLKKGDYYLTDVEYEINIDNSTMNIFGFKVNKDLRLLIDDFEKAEEIRKTIFIETGLDLQVKKFEKEEN